MELKSRPNHSIYLETLRRMSGEERVLKAIELSEMSKEVFKAGLRKRFPDLAEEEFHQVYLERLAKCHNQNW